MSELRLESTVTEPEFGGPHTWQTQLWAKLVRRGLRHREYLRWVDQYCTSVSVKGREHLERLDGPAIFIANHQSHMDTPVLMSAMTRKVQNNLYFGAAADRWRRGRQVGDRRERGREAGDPLERGAGARRRCLSGGSGDPRDRR